MNNGSAGFTLSDPLSSQDRHVPDSAIAVLLGKGWGYDDWEREIKSRGYVWSEGLKNVIIGKEREMFKDEILFFRLEPAQRAKGSYSNSTATILKRIMGEEWFAGRPIEKQQRLDSGRLYGKDAKPRCLQDHVRQWEIAAAASANTGANYLDLTSPTRTRQGITSPVQYIPHPPMVVNSLETMQQVFNHNSGLEYFNGRQFPTSYLEQGSEAPMSSLTPSSGPCCTNVNVFQSSLNCSFGSSENVNNQIMLKDGTMVSQDALLGNHFPHQVLGLGWIPGDREDANETVDKLQPTVPAASSGFMSPQAIPGQTYLELGCYDLGCFQPIILSHSTSQDEIREELNRAVSPYTQLPPQIEDNLEAGQAKKGCRPVRTKQHYRQASDTSMPDCVPSSVSTSVEVDDISHSLPKSAATDRVLGIREPRSRAIIRSRDALRRSQIKLKAVQEKLDTIKALLQSERDAKDLAIAEKDLAMEDLDIVKSLLQKEKDGKDLAIAENVGLRDKVARLERVAKRPSQQAMRDEIIAINESMQQNISHEIALQTISKSNPSLGNTDGTLTRRRHFPSRNQPLPLRTVAATLSNYAIRGTGSHRSLGSVTDEALPITTIYAGDGNSVSRCYSENETTTEGPHNLGRPRKHKMGSILRPHREENYDSTPQLLEIHIHKHWEVHSDLKRPPTIDSGYASGGPGETPRDSEADRDRRCNELRHT